MTLILLARIRSMPRNNRIERWAAYFRYQPNKDATASLETLIKIEKMTIWPAAGAN